MTDVFISSLNFILVFPTKLSRFLFKKQLSFVGSEGI